MRAYPREILHAALQLQEYERKQIAMALLASMLTPMAVDEVIEIHHLEEENGTA